MRINKLYPVEVFEFDLNLDDTWVKHVREMAVDEQPTMGVLNTHPRLNSDPKFAQLVLILQDCLQQVHEHYNFDCEGFKISSMWGNYYRPGTAQQEHRHANSFFSGNLFLTEGAPLIFYDPIQQRSFGQFEIFTMPKLSKDGIDQNGPKFEKIYPKPGKLVIFPSWFVHNTAIAEEDRYTISFNSLPYGSINQGIANIDVR